MFRDLKIRYCPYDRGFDVKSHFSSACTAVTVVLQDIPALKRLKWPIDSLPLSLTYAF